ncbi:hypothetical protein [Nocardia sp. NPDC060259]|uniref:hypothetical protein n=1 Tax=Nocardia sp. NPDC060259 TaxID=3347088 RepID=UPI003646FB87
MTGEHDVTAAVSPIPGAGAINPTQLTQLVNAQQKLVQAQARTGRSDQALGDLGAGTDADFVQGAMDYFDSWTHQRIYDSVNGPGGMNVTGLQTLRKAWKDAFTELSNLSAFTQLGLNRIFSEGKWEGSAGQAGLAAASLHTQTANQIAQVFGTMSDRMDAVSAAAEATRAAVPPPAATLATIDPDDPLQSVLPGLINPEYETQLRQQAEAQRLAAVAAMNSVYTPNYPPTGSGVPSYATVSNIGDPGASGGTQGPSSTTPTTAAGQPVTGDTTPEQSEGQRPATVGSPGDTEAGSIATDSAASSPDTDTSTSAASTATAPTTPDTGTRTGAGLPGGGGVPTGAGGGTTGAPMNGMPGGTPRVPIGSGAPPTAGSPSAGRSGAAGGTGAGSTGRSSSHPMGPMGQGAGRRSGGGDDENEHRAPDYLRGVQPDWLTGITAHAGVLGENPILGEPRDVPLAPPRPLPATEDTTAATRNDEPAPAPNTPAAPEPPSPVTEPPGNNAEVPEATPSTTTVTGTAPALDDLFAEYGWTTDDSTSPDADQTPSSPDGVDR